MEDLNPEGDGTEPPRPLHDAAPGSLHADSPATVQQQQGQEQVKEDPHEQQQQQQQHQMQDRIPLVCGETRGFYLPTMQGVVRQHNCHCTATAAGSCLCLLLLASSALILRLCAWQECHCTACEQRAALLKRNVLITPSEFERHAGGERCRPRDALPHNDLLLQYSRTLAFLPPHSRCYDSLLGLSHIKQWRHTVKVVEEAEAGGSAASCRRPLGDWLLVHGGDAGNGDATSSGEGLQSASGGGGQQQLKPAHALLFGRVKAAPSQYHHQQQQAVPTPLGLPILPERRLQPTVAPLPNLPPLITRRQPAGQPPPARARTRPRPQLSPSQVVLASGGVLRSASTDSALHSPAGRAWMAAEPRQHDVRVGPVYQASVPDARGAPSGAGLAGEAGEQQAGLPGPTESVAMGLATEGGPCQAWA